MINVRIKATHLVTGIGRIDLLRSNHQQSEQRKGSNYHVFHVPPKNDGVTYSGTNP